MKIPKTSSRRDRFATFTVGGCARLTKRWGDAPVGSEGRVDKVWETPDGNAYVRVVFGYNLSGQVLRGSYPVDVVTAVAGPPPPESLKRRAYKPLTEDQRTDLGKRGEAFFWACHMNDGSTDRLPNPAESAAAQARLHLDDIMTGRKKVVGQHTYAAAHTLERITPQRWIEEVRKAQERGYPLKPAVIAEADAMEAAGVKPRTRAAI